MPATIPSCPPRKRRLAAAARFGGATAAATAWERRRPALRIVNCHSVPSRFAGSFAAQVRQLSRSWTFASPSDLRDLLQRGVKRPTLLFCFDDGLANTIRYASPILEAAGARAIFAVPAAWPDIAPDERRSWFRRHVYPTPTELHELEEDIEAASWEDLRALVSRGHEVWSHGLDHVRLREDTPPDVLEREIVDSKAILERRLMTTVHGYCPPVSYTVPPDGLALISATYDLAFGGRPSRVPIQGDVLQIPRSNIEASWPWTVVEMQLSPLGDAMSRALERLRA